MRALGIVTLAALAGAFACGNDDNSGSGVSSNKRVSDLTTDEATALCHANKPKFDAIATGGCRSATGSIDPAVCASCETTESIDCAGTDTSVLVGCTVTVGEMESCLGQMAEALKGITCENPQASGAFPACFEPVRTKCSLLFGGGEPPAGDGGR